MRKDILTEYYRPLLEQNNFRSVPCPDKFGPAGRCWKILDTVGSGYYWVYARQDLFDIKIHDFYFHEDFCLDVEIPECISIQRYRALIHKRIPIHSVGIEILPAYYQGFLKKISR